MKQQHITLVVTGSIAAVKTFDLIHALEAKGMDVSIFLTDAAQQWVTREAAQEIMRGRVLTKEDITELPEELARSKAILVAPASADIMKQLVQNDTPLANALNDSHKPLLISPAMNVMMWQHPATQRNLATLRMTGAHFIGPVVGNMACGDKGFGRFMEPKQIAEAVSSALSGDVSHPAFAAVADSIIPDAKLPEFEKGDKKKVLLVIQGGRDALGAYPLISALRSRGYDVKCVIGHQAAHLLPGEGIATISGHRAYTHHYQEDPQGMEHIRLPEQADVVLFAPATAIGVTEMAQGGATSFSGCLYLASKKPVVVVPSADPLHAVRDGDLEQLKADGAHILTIPKNLPLAGKERANAIANAFDTLMKEKDTSMHDSTVKGKKILVVGGSPRERVDTFRFYYNDERPETQGADVAAQLARLGANVTLVTPNSSHAEPDDVKIIKKRKDGSKIESAKDLIAASVELGEFDAVLQLANPSTITCPNPASVKLQKTDTTSRAQMFTVAGNIDMLEKLKAAFPESAVAGLDAQGRWQSQGDDTLTALARPFAEAAMTHAPESKDASKMLKMPTSRKLASKRIIVTTARTEENVTEHDKITNFFSGRQGQAIATAFADMGADVVLISGPTHIPDLAHSNIKTIHVKTAREMHAATQAELATQADAFIGTAAVADFGTETPMKMHLKEGEIQTLELTENPSIVGGAAHHANRPRIVVSFAAQSTETILEYAQKKFAKLGADLTVANPIGEDTAIGRDATRNQVIFITADGVRRLPEMDKSEVGLKIADEVAMMLLKAKPVTRNDPTEPSAGIVAR